MVPSNIFQVGVGKVVLLNNDPGRYLEFLFGVNLKPIWILSSGFPEFFDSRDFQRIEKFTERTEILGVKFPERKFLKGKFPGQKFLKGKFPGRKFLDSNSRDGNSWIQIPGTEILNGKNPGTKIFKVKFPGRIFWDYNSRDENCWSKIPGTEIVGVNWIKMVNGLKFPGRKFLK